MFCRICASQSKVLENPVLNEEGRVNCSTNGCMRIDLNQIVIDAGDENGYRPVTGERNEADCVTCQ
jgi:hypothetical protein